MGKEAEWRRGNHKLYCRANKLSIETASVVPLAGLARHWCLHWVQSLLGAAQEEYGHGSQAVSSLHSLQIKGTIFLEEGSKGHKESGIWLWTEEPSE